MMSPPRGKTARRTAIRVDGAAGGKPFMEQFTAWKEILDA